MDEAEPATEPAADGERGKAATERVALTFDDGLAPVIAQDADTGEVLMLAYASPEAVARTQETGEAHYYSRSRDELWHKGATSGNVQAVAEVRVDCDADALLYRVDQSGGACHTGYRSCFHRSVRSLDQETDIGIESDGESDGDDEGGETALAATVEVVGDRVFDPEDAYGEG